MAMVCSKRSFEHIVKVYANLVVPGLGVELHEELGAMKFIQELLDNRNRELVLDGAFC
jgi:hypothetical protein